MRIAKSFNRDNKLFKQIKSIYFSGRRKKEFGNLNYSTDKFIKEEILRCSKSRIIRSRDRFFKKKVSPSLKICYINICMVKYSFDGSVAERPAENGEVVCSTHTRDICEH